MNNFKIHTVNTLEFEGLKYREGQTVNVRIINCNWRSYCGKIIHINSGYIELDCSTKHNKQLETLFLKDIVSIANVA